MFEIRNLWRRSLCVGLLLSGSSISISVLADEVTASSEQIDFFEKNIRPLLIETCYECHSSQADRVKGGLQLDSRQGWVSGGDSGPAIVPGKADESLLIEAVRYQNPDLEMPPNRRLEPHEIELLVQWVNLGAPDPRTQPSTDTSEREIDIEQGRKFWSFQPPQLPEIPSVDSTAWPRNEIDYFVLATLEDQGLEPVDDTNTYENIRRTYFDLIGLPPTPSQIQFFLNADPEMRFEGLVDQLLSSHHFGEKWGRHWLDLARYAESTGGGRSEVLPNAWRYRNYVIDAYNDDKPFDVFIREQIAGDLLPYHHDRQRADYLIATGFLAMGPKNRDLQDKELLRMNTVDEQIDTIGRAFLGLTVGCARCHDHKFDPIPTRDYYAMAGILRSTKALVLDNVSKLVKRELPGYDGLKKSHQEYDSKAKQLTADIKRLKAVKPQTESSTAALKQYETQLAVLKEQRPQPMPKAISVMDQEEVGDYSICIRGNVHQLGQPVPRGFLQVAYPESAPPQMPTDSSGRRELAEWLATPTHPLTARVYVNRIWHHLFGAGLVRTTDDFGSQGERPSHPELLDYLAVRFVSGGWSTKELIRFIVQSRTYQLSTRIDPTSRAADPENRWLWRMNRRRMSAEAIRDAILMVSGGIRAEKVECLLPPEAVNDSALNNAKINFRDLVDPDARSVYIPVFREEGLNDLFDVFDFANPGFGTGRRSVSNLPTQALYLMNSPWVREQAGRAARMALDDSSRSDEERIQHAYLATVGRPANDDEFQLALAYVTESTPPAPNKKQRLAAWTGLYHTLYSCIDFRYLN